MASVRPVRRSLLATAVAAVLAAGALAPAGATPTRGDDQIAQALVRLDTDADGQLTMRLDAQEAPG